MKHARIVKLLAFAFVFGLSIPSAHAAITTFEKPALNSIVKALIRFGAVDIYDDDMTDIFARTNECGLYRKYYKEVFKWEKLRAGLRESIRQDIATYPTGFRYETALTLDRYDFKRAIYPFHDVTRYQSVNTFTMETHRGDFCTEDDLKGFPTLYKLVLDKPLTLEGLPLNEAEGEALFNRMAEAKNKDHMVYANFNLRLAYVASLASARDKQERGYASLATRVKQEVQYDSVILDSKLDSIEYYEDAARKKLIYIYRP